jgi:hypothetical protein
MRLLNAEKTLYERSGKRGLAFWLRGDDLYEVRSTHIRFVIENPDLFDIPTEEIHRIYREQGEPIGFEGRARKEIIAMLIENGWIRIRHYVRPQDYWTVQHDRSIGSQESVIRFLTFARERCGMTEDDRVVSG